MDQNRQLRKGAASTPLLVSSSSYLVGSPVSRVFSFILSYCRVLGMSTADPCASAMRIILSVPRRDIQPLVSASRAGRVVVFSLPCRILSNRDIMPESCRNHSRRTET
eukprot:3428543-Rhodomonas_salina.1